ncbi:MAG TPA: hypothetical protein VFY26_07070 [Anaerolineales bacterium]|nr:hypothetical protein [Anaerolineales bacterium]
MTLFAANEKIELVATQSFKYDNYSGCQYSLERIDVNGKCGLACVEEQENCGAHTKILLHPVFEEICIRKISTPKANYDRYAVFANGDRVGDFTMVLNSWVPRRNS